MLAHREIAQVRFAVAFLGESHCAGWWESRFFGPESAPFLCHVFGQNLRVSQFLGSVEAARQHHDRLTGLGPIFHLFRLPEIVEQDLYDYISSSQLDIPENRDGARNMLVKIARTTPSAAIGPVRIGTPSMVADPVILSRMATIYLCSFDTGQFSFPYFSD
jgi:hypothetical protein